MYIQRNIPAMNMMRNWQQHNQNASTALQRIASGKRILSGADDAAGLSIAERLRSQLRMNSVEQNNTEDMKAQYEAADAVLGQVQTMLQRMTELSTQAASGAYYGVDRENLNKEYQQLIEEIDRILPSASVTPGSLFGSGGVKAGAAKGGVQAEGLEFYTNDIGGYLDSLNGMLDQLAKAAKEGDKEGALKLGVDLSDNLTDSQRVRIAVAEFTKKKMGEMSAEGKGEGGFTITITGDNVSVAMKGQDSKDLGLKGTDLLSGASASEAMDAVSRAVDNIAAQRGSLGAMMNQMQRTKDRLARMEVDMTDTLSRIEDADMAKEIMNYTKSQLLSQVNAFLASKTIHQPEMVLKMLRNEM